jgi:hypothetical protein
MPFGLRRLRRPSPTAPELAAPGPRRWPDLAAERPWFDRPDALDHLRRRVREGALGAREQALLRQWVKDGYFVVDDCVDERAVARLSDVIDGVWFRTEPLTGLLVSDVKIGDVTHVHYRHEDLIRLPLDVRERARAESNWRIGELHLYDDRAAEVFRSEALTRLASLVLDRPTIPQFSLTFSKGSRQQLHQDTCVFHVHPRNFLCGALSAPPTTTNTDRVRGHLARFRAARVLPRLPPRAALRRVHQLPADAAAHRPPGPERSLRPPCA